MSGWVNTWSSRFHGKIFPAETDGPVASSWLCSGSFLPRYVLLLNFTHPLLPCLRFTVMGDMIAKVDKNRLFRGGQQPYSSPDWTTYVNIPILSVLQPLLF